ECCHHDHEHHHHHEDEECCHHDHEHHHHHEDGECSCHDHEHHHHHHHADDVFTSWGFETPRAFTVSRLEEILQALGDSDSYGMILRAKGMVPSSDGETWLYFDMVPEEHEIREGRPEVTGKICVIGSGIQTDKLKALFEA
ncbi:MAG: GTP-binding protein, partial [Clostridiales bacterium]|nr:GTP-binding protein [Clostridiales bacterium]